MATPRSYGHYCTVASALDVLGERWTLLVARDLLSGPKRYTDLQEGMPGIATDLLTARLRTLEEAGLVQRRRLPKPAPAAVYELTERGDALVGPVVASLARLGFTLLDDPPEDATIPPDALVLSLRAAYHPEAARDAAYQLELDGDTYAVRVGDGEVLEAARGTVAEPDATLRTDPVTLVRLLRRTLAPGEAVARGTLSLDGPRRALERFVEAFAWAV